MSKFGYPDLIANTNLKEKKVIEKLTNVKTKFNNNIHEFETSGRMSNLNLSGDKSTKKKSSEIELKSI